MKNLHVSLLTLVLLGVAGCGAAEPELATNVSDFAGNWESFRGASEVVRQRQTFEVTEDGEAELREFTSDGFQKAHWVSVIEFEDGNMVIESPECLVGPIGTYEVYLLGDGNISFVPIEDECAFRARTLAGPGDDPTRVWSPIP